MDVRLLRRLRKESKDAYGVEKKSNRSYDVVVYTGVDKGTLFNYETFADAKYICDLRRRGYVYEMVLKMRMARNRFKRIY